MQSETWTAVGSPHLVSHFGGTLQGGYTITVEPCAVLKMSAGTNIVVPGWAKFIAKGTATSPILIEAADTEEWGSLTVGAAGRNVTPGEVDLAYVTLRRGGLQDPSDGAANSEGGVLAVRGDDPQLNGLPTVASLRVDHVSIEDTPDWGLRLVEDATFTSDSTALTIKNAKRGAARIALRSISTLPTVTLSGNGNANAIIIVEGNTLHGPEAYTLHDRGVTYVLGDKTDSNTNSSVDVGSSTKPGGSFTIEPGVTLKMFSNWTFDVQGSGVFTAKGTAAKPIVMTSAEATPQPGDWAGVLLTSSGASDIEYTTIAYGGGPSSASFLTHCELDGSPSSAGAPESAAILLTVVPTKTVLAHNTIRDSKAFGINEAFIGAKVDYTGTNTFTNNALCAQSTPQLSDNVCPATVTCP